MFTSLTLLYGLTLLILIAYSIRYYNNLARKNRFADKRWFITIFLFISLLCSGFLLVNFFAPLKFKVYSNLDHHFLQHDGYRVHEAIELGNTDTNALNPSPYNSFILSRNGTKLKLQSGWSEEPFFANQGTGAFNLLSKNFSAAAPVQFISGKSTCVLQANASDNYSLKINQQIFTTTKILKRGSSAWNLFKDDSVFIRSADYGNEELRKSLKNIFILSRVIPSDEKEFAWFLSSKVFRTASAVIAGGQNQSADNKFETELVDGASIAWGIGFRENNKNQFRLHIDSGGTFSVINRFPVSYPLTEENKGWQQSTVNKFLVSDPQDLVSASTIHNEGFYFDFYGRNKSARFYPVLLSYQKLDGHQPVDISVRSLERPKIVRPFGNSEFYLPAISGMFDWKFSVQDSFYWKFSNATNTDNWVWQIAAAWFLFLILVIGTVIVTPSGGVGFIWQILACISMVLITTRIFLYWRYKSFPPYDAMDLPSQEQLANVWNYWVILGSVVLLAFVFGWRFFQYLFNEIRNGVPFLRKSLNKGMMKSAVTGGNTAIGAVESKWNYLTTQKFKLVYVLISWFLILCGGFILTKVFSSYTRQICMFLVVLYFFFLYLSYRHSPLVSANTEAWWRIDTNKLISLLVSNPVKIILSLSLFITLVFIDIGLGIIFFNFLLFHEIWLCYNYAIAGSSTGRAKNARIFLIAATIYLAGFIVNLQFLPNILNLYLKLPQQYFAVPLAGVCMVISVAVFALRIPDRRIRGIVRTVAILIIAVPFFVPKKEILKKAESTRYRIDVLAMPVEQVIEQAYLDGNNSTPVIRAAQNQWFINTFVLEENNPNVNALRFNMLPHAPQNRGAKYNAQATDLVSSRFLIAEHGKFSVLLYVLLLLIPVTLSAAFYKLYPDFTKPTNYNYPAITTGFSIMNYLFTSGLLVILAATGKYIFFGQDLPFGSILSKLSIIFPVFLIILVILLFNKIPLQYYSNKLKLLPGLSVFVFLAITLLFIRPSYNKHKEFGIGNMMQELGTSIDNTAQPVLNYFDTTSKSARLDIRAKDLLFRDSLKKMLATGNWSDDDRFLYRVLQEYSRGTYADHINQANIVYLDNHSGLLGLSVNENYFRVQAPPHLRNYWTGSVYSDPFTCNVSIWNPVTGQLLSNHLSLADSTMQSGVSIDSTLRVSMRDRAETGKNQLIILSNTSSSALNMRLADRTVTLKAGDTMHLQNPSRIAVSNAGSSVERTLVLEPDAFMKNCFVNGSRYYTYPAGNRFIWARNFSETIAGSYTNDESKNKNAFISINPELNNSMYTRIDEYLKQDTGYDNGAEYAITIADSYGRILSMTDYIKGLDRPDPNDKATFNEVLFSEENFSSQQYLRKQIGNLNLLRMNPGPGSTLKPIVFAAVASQIGIDWSKFGSTGFTGKQGYYGGEKVAPYDFEVNHGAINKVSDYLKVSDNYYHSNVLLLGSYPKEDFQNLLLKNFSRAKTAPGFQWPYLSYAGSTYWLNDYKYWPGFAEGKAEFGLDSSFINIGMYSNFGIFNKAGKGYYQVFATHYDSVLFRESYKNSAYVLPEYGVFDQQATGINKRIPYDVFAYAFRQHVKGSSQVLIPPVKMTEAFGRLVSQNRQYTLTLDPDPVISNYSPFYTDNRAVSYDNYQELMQQQVFAGMRDALLLGTAAALGRRLTNGKPYFYYVKTGTTGDDRSDNKSRLFVIVISLKDITKTDTDLRSNKFYTIYFTSQNGPNRQNEALQEEVIKYVESTPAFKEHMKIDESGRLTKKK